MNGAAPVYSDRAPEAGETIAGTAFALGLGGKGANQAVAVARSGARSVFVASTGQDAFGALVRSELAGHGVALDHVAESGADTGVAHIRVAGDGENSIVIVEGANGAILPEHIDRAFAAEPDARVLLVQLEVPLAVTRYAIERAKERGMIVILDPAPARALPEDLWALVDVVTPNETEAAVLTGTAAEPDGADAERLVAEWFLARGTASVVLTRGARGTVVVTNDALIRVPALAVTPVDSTAAGDTFAGYLGSALAAGQSLEDSVRLAAVAGGLSVTRAGASSSIPSRDEVQRVLDDAPPGQAP